MDAAVTAAGLKHDWPPLGEVCFSGLERVDSRLDDDGTPREEIPALAASLLAEEMARRI